MNRILIVPIKNEEAEKVSVVLLDGSETRYFEEEEVFDLSGAGELAQALDVVTREFIRDCEERRDDFVQRGMSGQVAKQKNWLVQARYLRAVANLDGEEDAS